MEVRVGGTGSDLHTTHLARVCSSDMKIIAARFHNGCLEHWHKLTCCFARLQGKHKSTTMITINVLLLHETLYAIIHNLT